MTTIRDVAKAAGVAPITVSRVINNTGYIREQTRERVLAAVKELGYVPNSLALSLRWKQTGILALVLTDITNPFWTTVARGVEDAASQAGLSIILCNTDEDEHKQERYLNVMLQRRVDGVLLVPVNGDPAAVDLIQRQSTPLVILDRRTPGAAVDVVRCDSEGGAYQLTQHLIALGHRRIAMLSGPQSASSAVDRAAGYRKALSENGIQAEQILYGSFSVESGYQMARQALESQPCPTALFAGNNFIAIGALKYLRERGIQVPGEISLVGFDDLPQSLVVDPFLTAAAQPAYEMGFKATQRLLQHLTGQGHAAGSAAADPAGSSTDEYTQEIVLPVSLMIRGSSGPAPR